VAQLDQRILEVTNLAVEADLTAIGMMRTASGVGVYFQVNDRGEWLLHFIQVPGP
jgi:hypothetical protein